MALQKISTYDSFYQTGFLSDFPLKIDSYETLYEAKNLSESTLKTGVNMGSTTITVQDATNFPSQGILKIGSLKARDGNSEIVYYYKKSGNTFSDLIRGFQNSRILQWPKDTSVYSGVFAEHHNSLKDAIQNIENKLGKKESPLENSLNGILNTLETTILNPKPIFRASPIIGSPPFNVNFKNYTLGKGNKYFWDFGDNSTSTEENPIHTYAQEGNFTVQLNVINSLGGQGIVTKSAYINSNIENKTPFFYVTPRTGGVSIETAAKLNISPTTFTYVDQTNLNIVNRFFAFGDGAVQNEIDPNIHVATHQYEKAGTYQPYILDTLESQNVKSVYLQEVLIVS
jgi:PKD repeat protein